MRKAAYQREGDMFNPPHPGEILKELYLKPSRTTSTEFAQRLGVDRKTVSRIINGRSGVTAETALRLGKLLNTSPEMWLGIQLDYDLWQTAKACRKELQRIKPMILGDFASTPA